MRVSAPNGERSLAVTPGPHAAVVPATMAFVDLAKMWGCARGRSRRVTEEIFYD